MGVGVVMKEGKITVTGNEASNGKNVECGFIPAYVKIFNQDVNENDVATLERWRGMPQADSLATLQLENDGDGTGTSPVNVTSVGLSDYNANAVSQVETSLSGSSFARTIDNTLLTGTASSFLTEVNVGDRVRVGGEFLEVASITSDTVLNTTSVWRDDTAATSATVAVPGAEVSQSGFKGFSIPASFMASGDILWFHAIGTQFDEEDA